MIWTTCKKILKKKSAPHSKSWWLTQKHMLPFSPDVKMISAYFYFSFQGFSKRISCDPNPDSEVWTEEMKLFALDISYSTKLWLIHSFLVSISIKKRFRCLRNISSESRQKHLKSCKQRLNLKRLPHKISLKLITLCTWCVWDKIRKFSCQPLFSLNHMLSFSVLKILIWSVEY